MRLRPSTRRATRWLSQILSNRVLGTEVSIKACRPHRFLESSLERILGAARGEGKRGDVNGASDRPRPRTQYYSRFAPVFHCAGARKGIIVDAADMVPYEKTRGCSSHRAAIWRANPGRPKLVSCNVKKNPPRRRGVLRLLAKPGG